MADEAPKVAKAAAVTAPAAPAPRPIPLAEWAANRLKEGERYLLAGFVAHCKVTKVLHAVEAEFERLYDEFKHKPVR